MKPIMTLSLGLAIGGILCTVASGEDVKLGYMLEVDSVDDPNAVLQGEVLPGDILQFAYLYDSTVEDVNPLPEVGDYYFQSPPYGASVRAGSWTFYSDPAAPVLLIEIVDDMDGVWDQYALIDYHLVSDPPLPGTDWMIRFYSFLKDLTGTAQSSPALPVDPPYVPGFQDDNTFRIEGMGPSDSFTITGTILRADLFCMMGNVNDLYGPVVDTLFIGGSTGSHGRTVTSLAEDWLLVFVSEAPVPALGSKYYVGGWSGAVSGPITGAVLPASLGTACFQPITTRPDYVAPITCANTIKPNDTRVDPPGPYATGDPLNGNVIEIPPFTFPPGTVLTFQGFVGDGASTANVAASLTNAVMVVIE